MSSAKSRKSAPKAKAKGKEVTEVSKEQTVAYWAGEIAETWQGAVDSIIATGEKLIEAKAALKAKGAWTKLIEDELPFSKGTVSKLIKIAGDPRLTKVSHAKLLPPSWNTLYMLSNLDDKTFKSAMDKGTINPEMERADAEKLLGKAKSPIDRKGAADAEVVEDDDDDQRDDNAETEVSDEDDDEPTPTTRKQPSGPTQVAPKMSKADKVADSLMEHIQTTLTRIEQFEEELDKSEDLIRQVSKSKFGREMFDDAERLAKNLNRIVKKYT